MNTTKLRNNHRTVKPPAILLLIAVTAGLRAQPSLPANPAEAGLAGSTVARTGSSWLARSNPASIGALEERSLHVSFSPSMIGIEGYYETYAVAAFPHDSGTGFGGSVQGAGVRGYREIAASAIGSTTIGGLVRVGCAINLHSLAIDRYGSAATATLDLGTIARLGERISFGGTMTNVGRGRLSGTDLPQRVAFGFAFDLGELTLSADAWQELRRSAGAAIGLSGSPMPGLMLRGGIGNGPGTIAIGIGYEAGGIAFDYGGSYIAPLGLRHVMGAGIRF